MDKFLGVCPIGIGDVWRRLVAKCVLTGAGHSANTSCGSDQLCAGLRAGIDGAIHGVSTLYNELEDSDSNSGFLLIGANNAFNEINRIPVIAPILAPILGIHFWGSISPSKMGLFAPFSATIQALSRARAFLSG
jgi:uncharacterized protein YsxB (DUF464 family)